MMRGNVFHDVYFFTFAFLPPFPDRFTVEHDWLFSLKHIADALNLLVLLLPGLPILVALAFVSPFKSVLRRSDYVFLAALAFPTMLAVYVFNPGIGMPRNWDLFSIEGIPLVVLGYYFAVNSTTSVRMRAAAAVLSIILALLVLGPRVASQVEPEIGVAHFKNYLVLDKTRNRNARVLLEDYYKSIGDTANLRQAVAASVSDFPEVAYNNRARELYRQNKYPEAMALWRQAIVIDPVYFDAYNNLGAANLDLNRPDQALPYLEIADGLNPYNALTVYNIGTVYLRANDLTRAEKFFIRAMKLDSTAYQAIGGLVNVYISLGKFDRAVANLAILDRASALPYDYYQSTGDALVARQAFPQAAQAYRFALHHGLDSAYVRKQEAKYPALQR